MGTKRAVILVAIGFLTAACTDADNAAADGPEEREAETSLGAVDTGGDHGLEIEAGRAHIGVLGVGAEVELATRDLGNVVVNTVIDPGQVAVLRPSPVALAVALDEVAQGVSAASVTISSAVDGDVLMLDPSRFELDGDGRVLRADGTETGIEAARIDAAGDTLASDGGSLGFEFTGEVATADYRALLESVLFWNQQFRDPGVGFDERLALTGSREITFVLDDAGGQIEHPVAFDVDAPVTDPDDFDHRRASGGVAMAGSGAADRMFGGDGDDVLYGAGGDNVLVGGAGDNVLAGGSGSNLMVAGPGRDHFVFTSLGGAIDVVVGFDAGNGDFLDLEMLAEALHSDLPEAPVTPDNADNFLRLVEADSDEPELEAALAPHVDNDQVDLEADATYHWLEVNLHGTGNDDDFETLAVLVDGTFRDLVDGVNGWIAV